GSVLPRRRVRHDARGGAPVPRFRRLRPQPVVHRRCLWLAKALLRDECALTSGGPTNAGRPMPTPAPPKSPISPRSWLVLGGLVVVLLVALWRLTPLRTLVDARVLAAWGREIAAGPAVPALVVAF